MNSEKYIFENISKHYIDEFGHPVYLLNDISFKISKGKISSILAPAGTGKSSLLKILAGLELADEGKFEKKVSSIYIPSDPSSFPWLSVEENIEFGIDNPKKENTLELIKLVGLEGYEEHRPNNSSIGFRFRISLARALARKPEVILIDEPFNKVNQDHKKELYQMLIDLVKKTSQTIILATTNITEAICLADKVFLMKSNPGEIIGENDINLDRTEISKLLSSEELKTTREIINSQLLQKDGDKLVSYTL